jgi:hypothetical protein
MAVHGHDTAGLKHKFAKAKAAVGHIDFGAKVDHADDRIGHLTGHCSGACKRIRTLFARRAFARKGRGRGACHGDGGEYSQSHFHFNILLIETGPRPTLAWERASMACQLNKQGQQQQPFECRHGFDAQRAFLFVK